MTAPPYSLAALVATGEPERLYAGLSALVSTAADGAPCAALASFRALDLMLADDLLERVSSPEATPSLSPAGRDTFARSLVELRDTARELDSLTLYACSASVETMGLDADVLDGVMSTPRFLREVEGAPLLFV